MGYLDAVNRIGELRAMIGGMAGSEAAAPGAAPAVFANALAAATSGSSPPPANAALAAAQSQLGQSEQPPGSNDGPAVARYRHVAGSYPGAPWCGYFVSWCAQQAGTPLGDNGQGLGSVADITSWAARTGRLADQPAPGELILFGDAHVGIVESVNADGSLTTIEGNAGDAVSREQHLPSDATGYVRIA